MPPSRDSRRTSGDTMTEEPIVERLTARVAELEAALEKAGDDRRNLEIYDKILSTIRDPVSMVNRRYEYLLVNHVYRDFFGIMPERLVGRSIREMWGEEIFHRVRPYIDRCFQGEDMSHQMWLGLPNGKRMYVDRRYFSMREPDGAISAVIMSSRDITPLKQAEELLMKRTRDLGERVKELNCLFGMSILLENPHITIDDFFRDVPRLVCGAMRYPNLACARIILEGGGEYATPNFDPSGEGFTSEILVRQERVGFIEIRYLTRVNPGPDGAFMPEEKVLLYSVAERLSKVLEYRRTEVALAESEERFRRLVESLPVGIAIVRDDQLMYRNPALDHMGLFPGTDFREGLSRIMGPDRDRLMDLREDIRSGRRRDAELDFRFTRDEPGGEIHVNCRMNLVSARNADSVLMTLSDVTRAREMERLLRARDKMASLGRVAAGIAHEIRNPLSGINIYLDALHQAMADHECPERMFDILERTQAVTARIEKIIKRVMDFARTGDLRLQPMRLGHPVEEAVQLSAQSLRKKGIRIDRRFLPDDLECDGDPHLLEQVLLNLITNAADAIMEAGPKPKEPAEGEEPGIPARSGVILVETGKRGHEAWITVEDSGPGIPEHLKTAVFDPFYTTKAYGMGIGLSLCQRIINDHGGRLELEDGSLGGARFTLWLPLRNAKPVRGEKEAGND